MLIAVGNDKRMKKKDGERNRERTFNQFNELELSLKH